MNKLGWVFALMLVVAACGGSTDDDDNTTSSSSGGASSGGASSSGGNAALGDPKDFVAIDAAKLCAILLCPGSTTTLTQEDCVKAYAPLRVPQKCKTQVDGANCQSSASILEGCWGTCDPATEKGSCAGANNSTCSGNGNLLTLDCNEVCKASNATWTNVCGTSYEGQPSEDGKSKCFCK